MEMNSRALISALVRCSPSAASTSASPAEPPASDDARCLATLRLCLAGHSSAVHRENEFMFAWTVDHCSPIDHGPLRRAAVDAVRACRPDVSLTAATSGHRGPRDPARHWRGYKAGT